SRHGADRRRCARTGEARPRPSRARGAPRGARAPLGSRRGARVAARSSRHQTGERRRAERNRGARGPEASRLRHRAARAPRDQLKLRTEMDPALAVRVPAPLDEILGRMLARDPEKRFMDAVEALSELVNMETAPIDVAELVPPSSPPSRRRSMPPPAYQRPT